jgi:hypothetical protein
LPRATSWPKTLGILSVIFGGFGIIGGAIGASVPLALKFFQKAAGDRKDDINWEAVRGAVHWSALMSIGMAILALLLLIAGTGLIGRRRWAVQAAKVWAVLKILAVVIFTAINSVVLRGIAEAMRQAGAGTASAASGSSLPMGTIWSVAWGWALPISMLVWFARAEIREEVADWR